MPKMKAYATFDLYLADLPPGNRAIVRALRGFVRRAAPGLEEAVKWGNGCWLADGAPIAYVYSDTDHVQFGFIRGASLRDPRGLLQGNGRYVRHAKVRGVAGVDRKAFGALLGQAVRLGGVTRGSRTKRKTPRRGAAGRARRQRPGDGAPPMLTPTLRREAAGDEGAIRAVTRAAFEGSADGDEHELVDRLRSEGALAISLVAEVAGVLVGHVAFSPAAASDGSAGWFALGPVSVAPGHQGAGIGSSLIRTGLEELRRTGAAGCILTGDSRYYRRFGFEPAPSIAPQGQPAEDFQVRVLNGPAPTGVIRFHDAFGGPPGGTVRGRHPSEERP